MSDRFDLIIRNATAALPQGVVPADIGINGQSIAQIGDLSGASAENEVDARGLHVLPGVIDSQVHFREPGLEHKEDLATGTAAAALGGVTAIFEMPNTNPSTLTERDLADKVSRARGRAWCDFAFFMGCAAENVDRLATLERLPGCAGVKIFMGSSTGSLLVKDPEILARALANGTRRVAIHAEDEDRLRERAHLAKEGGHPRFHPVWRDEQTAIRATERVLFMAANARRRVHVLHITTADEIRLLSGFKDIATVEVTPQHLTLEAPDCYERLGALAQMNPPIRDGAHRAGLWQGVEQGIVDVIGSDHAPHTREEKARPYPGSPAGMPGVQTLVPVMLNHVAEGRLTLERFVDLTSAGPARIYNIARKGRIAVGYDADLTLVDLKAQREIRDADMASKCGWTPFDGKTVTGWPVRTVIRGSSVMIDDELTGKPRGEAVRFTECL
ncbi:MAG: dihydroorotase [Alphaproteobacteria bacterium]